MFLKSYLQICVWFKIFNQEVFLMFFGCFYHTVIVVKNFSEKCKQTQKLKPPRAGETC